MDENKLLNYLKGCSDPEECAEIESWYFQSDEHRQILEQLFFTIQLGERHAAYHQADVEQSFARFKRRMESRLPEKTVSRVWFAKKWRVAVAAFILGTICASSLFLFWATEPLKLKVSTAPRQRAQVTLPDGSKVWLNASTSLTYNYSWLRKERCVALNGEAYFEVARDERSPFIVESKKIRTKVLGTKFNVKAKPQEQGVVTTLLEGSVRVLLPNQIGEGILLFPGQSVKVNTLTFQKELKKMVSVQDVLLWIDGRIDFQEASLLEITERLSRYYDVQFEFKDERLKKESFTCLFHTDDKIEEIMDALTLTKRFKAKINDRHIVISDQ